MIYIGAGAQEIINHFEVGSNIAKPVTIKTNLGTFEINGGEQITGNISSLTAYDANGNKIVQNSYYKSEWNSSHTYHNRYYRFTDIYKTSTQSSNDNDTYGGDYGGYGSNGRHFSPRGLRVVDGTPNLQIRGGWAYRYGEFVSFRAELGSAAGIALAGGYGKNYFAQEGQYSTNSYFLDVLFFINSDLDGYDSYSFGMQKGGWWDGFDYYAFHFEYSHFFEDFPHLGYFMNVSLVGNMMILSSISEPAYLGNC